MCDAVWLIPASPFSTSLVIRVFDISDHRRVILTLTAVASRDTDQEKVNMFI